MIPRRSDVFFIFTSILLLLLGLMFIHASLKTRADRLSLLEKAEIVRRLGLSDLCLFTDARYTRHPSVADLNTPFQDYPMSFEHFPSGSLLTVPPHLKERSASVSGQ
jgi:hypothetical protein